MGVIIRQSIKGTIWTYIGVLLGAANIMWIFPYYLSPEEIGIYRVVIDLAILFAFFAGLGTGHIADRFYVKVPEARRSGFLGYVSLLAIIGYVLFGVIYFLFDDVFYQLFARNAEVLKDYKLYVLVLSFAFVILNMYDSFYRIRFNIVSTLFFREIFLRLVMTAFVVLVGWHLMSFDFMMEGVMWSYYFTILALGLWYYYRFIRPTAFQSYWPNKVMFKEMMSYFMVVFIGGGTTVLIARIDVLMIAGMMKNGLDWVAVYALGFFIVSIIEIPRRAISQISTPLIANAWHHNDIEYLDDVYKRSSINQLIVGGIIFMLIWISIDDLISIIPNSSLYAACKIVVLWVGIGKIIGMVTGLSGEIILQSRYYLTNILSTTVLVVLIALFNYLFIPLLGIEGAAIGTALAVFFYNLYKVVFLQVKLKMQPFSWEMFKVLVAGLLIYVPFAFWPSAAGGSVISVFLFIALKSAVYVIFVVPILYKLRVSKEMNALIDKGLGILQSLLGNKQ